MVVVFGEGMVPHPITSPRHWSEPELIGHVLAHEARAWTELLRRYKPVIYHCILKVLGRSEAYHSKANVDEVFAEVLVGLVSEDMRKLRLWDPGRGARLGTWIGLLARNAAHDFIRGAGNRPLGDSLDTRVDLAGEGSSPLDQILAAERRAQLDSLLAAYPVKDRELMALYFGRNLSPEKVAEELGISVKTVYTKKQKLLVSLAAAVPGA